MSSDFNFTVASWFLGNVHVKPISTHSEGGEVKKWQNSVHVVVECPLITKVKVHGGPICPFKGKKIRKKLFLG